jgi:uncharacterized protein YktA (UPF0223 family)
MTSSETSSSEASHQKLNITRSCSSSGDAKLKASRAVQWIQNHLSIAEDWKCKATVILNGFESIGCLSSKSVDKVQLYEVYNHYLHYSVFVSATRQEKQLCLQRCSFTMGMDLKLILHRTTTISAKRSLVIDQSFKRLFLMCWQFHVSFTPLYKGVKA